MLKRIIVVGTSGSGKTTLAQQIADKLNIKHIELDSLHWDANWTSVPADELLARVENAMNEADNTWTMDGNYSKVMELTWQRADTIIWLDYPRYLIYWRIITRTLKRVFMRQKLWNGNRESFRTSFFSKDSIIWWAHSTYTRRVRQYTQIMQSDEYPHLTFLRVTSPRETRNWLNSLPDG